MDMIETPTGILWIGLEKNKPQLNTATQMNFIYMMLSKKARLGRNIKYDVLHKSSKNSNKTICVYINYGIKRVKKQ